tara:strand:- start:177 stop:494 length:318 start_codon:yes stop_codon:yes gene_type:complete
MFPRGVSSIISTQSKSANSKSFSGSTSSLLVGVFVRVRVVTILRIVALAIVVGFLIGLLLLQSQYLSLQGLELDDERGWRVCRLIRSFGFVGAEEDQFGSENSEI